jgi:ubiquinol-cytochrome c reductase cytochrome c1 subunit
MMKKLFLILSLMVASLSFANEQITLDKAPIDPSNQASLQRGAKYFVNYCLNCHSAASMRYNRLQDIGLTEAQIKTNLLFAGEKVGDTMTVSMSKADAKAWFGAVPPDLSVEARARGADWLYTYLRCFYRDSSRPTGWNNLVFDKVGMPHVLWQLQGQQILKEDEATHQHKLVLEKSGQLTPAQYNLMVADLVNYLVYMAEPFKQQDKRLGLLVLAFLGVVLVLTYALKKEFWKDIH